MDSAVQEGASSSPRDKGFPYGRKGFPRGSSFFIPPAVLMSSYDVL